MMKVLTRISSLEAGKVRGSFVVDDTFWYKLYVFSAVYFPIIVSRAVGGYASQTRRCWRRCVQEAQEIFAVLSTVSSFPPFQVSGKALHNTTSHHRRGVLKSVHLHNMEFIMNPF